MKLEPIHIALIAAMITAAVLAWVPVDFNRDQHLKSWLPKRARQWKLQRILVHGLATAIVAGGSVYVINWQPDTDASAFSASVQGVAWGLGAFAGLRAELSGFRVSDATPGFSILRGVSEYLIKTADHELKTKVRQELPDDGGVLYKVSGKIIAQGWTMDKGGNNPDQLLAYNTVEVQHNDGAYDRMHEYVAGIVVDQRVTKCW